MKLDREYLGSLPALEFPDPTLRFEGLFAEGWPTSHWGRLC